MPVLDPAAPGAGPAELGRHESGVVAAAALPDGRVVTGGGEGRVLVWDPAAAGGSTASWHSHAGPVRALGCLPDGRVTGGDDGRVLVGDPAAPGAVPAELGRRGDWVWTVGGAARWPGSHRRRREVGAGVEPGYPRLPGPGGKGRQRDHGGARGRRAARWAGGHRRRESGPAGTGVGPGHAVHLGGAGPSPPAG